MEGCGEGANIWVLCVGLLLILGVVCSVAAERTLCILADCGVEHQWSDIQLSSGMSLAKGGAKKCLDSFLNMHVPAQTQGEVRSGAFYRNVLT